MSKVSEGQQVTTSDGRTGVVTGLSVLKSGNRGRPPLVATVRHEQGDGQYRISELTPIA